MLRSQLRGATGLRLIVAEAITQPADGSYCGVKIAGVDYPLVPKLRSPDYPVGSAVYLIASDNYMIAIGYQN